MTSAGRVGSDGGRVVVVGGGVSGCACALGLAAAGRSVLIVSSSLDSLGMPEYGPDLFGAAVSWREARDFACGLYPSLRRIWLREAMVSDGVALAEEEGRCRFSVDRRRVGLEVKWLLENVALAEMRQGVVVDVRKEGEGGREKGAVAVETAFGEVFAGEACVLAVGLGLGRTVVVGGAEPAGEAFGEVAGDRLRESLIAQGVGLRGAVREVGTWYSVEGAEEEEGRDFGRAVTEETRTVGSLAYKRVGDVVGEAVGEEAKGWRRILEEEERGALAEAEKRAEGHEGEPASPGGGSRLCVGKGRGEEGRTLLPDGTATREWYREGSGTEGGRIPTRPAYTVRADVVTGAGEGGSLDREGRLWAVGRVAGAQSYAESLKSGLFCSRALQGSWDREGKDLGDG